MAEEPTPEPGLSALAPHGGGWHCSHLYYGFDRRRLNGMTAGERREVADAFVATLDPADGRAPVRLQTQIVSGHKADFGLMMLDPDPLKLDALHQRLMAGPAGVALSPGYSFVSLTEISEYVQSAEQHAARIASEGPPPGSAAYEARVKAYADRLEAMNRQRLTPDFPPHRACCFYPMNKKREKGDNWFTLAKSERNRLMSEHARSGIAFAGRVSQLITVGVGFDDWEWGVTLWASNPAFLKDIVYRMRFDEASARYAEFGPFLVGYTAPADEIVSHCLVLA